MKLKVRMYAYSKNDRDYGIGKIVNITEYGQGFKGDLIDIQYKYSIHAISYQEVIASYDITDLIEKDDLIKSGSKIIQVTDEMLKMRDEQGIFGLPNHDHVFIDKINVDKILTHEQFESMAYKVD